MQLRFLRYFVALAETRHFARAAEVCAVAQPTLSAGIAALEQDLGQRLILRDRRFIGLTAEGRAVLPWAQRILADQAALRQAIAAEGPLAGELRLGVIPASMPAIGPFARALAAAHPAVTLAIRAMTSRQIERALIEHELDAGITYLSSEPPAQVDAVPLYDETYVLAVNAADPLARRGSIGWAEAAALPLCLLHRDMQNRRILDAHLAALGLSARPRATADSYVALASLVVAGGHASIVPDSYASLLPTGSGLALVPLQPPAPPNRIGLVVHDREPKPALAAAAVMAARVIGKSYQQS